MTIQDKNQSSVKLRKLICQSDYLESSTTSDFYLRQTLELDTDLGDKSMGIVSK